MTKEGLQSEPKPYRVDIFPSGRKPSQDLLSLYASQNAMMRLNQVQFAEYWQTHIDKSREAIRESVKGLSGHALILGLGNAMDIPLSELANQFESITAVKVDEASARMSVEQLAPQQQAKFRIIVDDLTGVAASAHDKMKVAADASPSMAEYTRQVTSLVHGFRSLPLQLSGKYDFVCSSLILTQLTSLLHDDSNEITKSLAGTMPPTREESYTHQLALTDLSKRLQREHVQMLGERVAGDGRVYLSDTVSRRFVVKVPGTQTVQFASEPLAMVSGPDLAQEIVKYFSPIRDEAWIWFHQPPAKAVSRPTQGDAFQVLAYTLVPK